MKRLFTFYALGVLGLYAVATWRGFELGAAKRGFIPAEARQAPGGYRSYTYWRGGK